MQISQEKLRKLKASAQIIEKGDFAVLEKILEFEDFLEDFQEKTKEEKDQTILELSSKLNEMKEYCETCVTNLDGKLSTSIEDVLSKVNNLNADIQNQIDSNKALLSEQSKKDIKTIKDDITLLRDTIANLPELPDLSIYDKKIEDVKALIPEIKEQAKETPEEIRDKLETLKDDNRLDKSAIKGLDEELKSIRSIKGATTAGLFGMKQMRMVSFSFSGDASTTVFYLPKEPGAKGLAIWAYYQGQHLQLGTHFTVANKTFTCVGFTPQTGSVIEGFIII